MKRPPSSVAAQLPKKLRLESKSAKKQPAAAMMGNAGMTDWGQGAYVRYEPRHFPRAESFRLLHELQELIPWEQREIRVMGRTVMQPRLIAYMADSASLRYTYSNTTLLPHAWTPTVLAIKEKVEAVASHTFNSCLLNLYRNGSDHLSWHSDNEPLYGPRPVIGSVSFGAPRDFILRRNEDHRDKRTFLLGPGDVMVMSGTMQDHWMHSVPKRANVPGPRINLTFSSIVGMGAP